jgi:SAM-dependent methyltransferase
MLLTRSCPVCRSDNFDEVLILHQTEFTTPNPGYRLNHIGSLGLNPEQAYPIVKCRNCDMVYSLYCLPDEAESIVYNQLIDPDASRAKVLTIARRIKDLKHWVNLLSLVEKLKPGVLDLKVVDYGCGWGSLLLDASGPGVQPIGFDVTEWKVAWAREQGLTICTSFEELKKYAPFDIGISTDVFEHMKFPREAVQELASLLKPGAVCLITCIQGEVSQALDWLEMKNRLAQGKPLPKVVNPWEHLNYFTIETLTNLLREYGFSPVEFPSRKRGWRDVFRGLKRSGPREIPQYWRFAGLSQ